MAPSSAEGNPDGLSLVEIWMIQSLQPASSQARRVEVDQQPGRMASQLQVRDDLRDMNGMDLFNCLDLHDESIVYEQVEREIV